MDTNTIIAIVALIMLFMIYRDSCTEGMSATRERATKIYSWFTKNDNPQYTDYRGSIEGGHNLEYYDVKNLKNKGELSIDAIERVL
jgi:hypothetical protein